MNHGSNHQPRRLWAWPHELEKCGILGINRRNMDYILQTNERADFPKVDNKLLTKQICHAHNIPVPETYCVIHRHGDLPHFFAMLGNVSDFVVKPASGAAGRGIMVLAERSGQDFKTAGGHFISWGDLRYHLSTTVSGLFSLGGQPDQAIVEQRIIMYPGFERIAVDGTPDIRVILYRQVPVMAMMRLPTLASGGRANLHQGAAAVAVDLITGETYGGVCNNRMVTHHPDTREKLAGLEVPGWKGLLTSAMKLGDALNMGYIGVDFVVDADIGPVVLEANARPGLAIQLAHGQGLKPVLDLVDSLSPEQRQGEARWQLIERLARLVRKPPAMLF